MRTIGAPERLGGVEHGLDRRRLVRAVGGAEPEVGAVRHDLDARVATPGRELLDRGAAARGHVPVGAPLDALDTGARSASLSTSSAVERPERDRAEPGAMLIDGVPLPRRLLDRGELDALGAVLVEGVERDSSPRQPVARRGGAVAEGAAEQRRLERPARRARRPAGAGSTSIIAAEADRSPRRRVRTTRLRDVGQPLLEVRVARADDGEVGMRARSARRWPRACRATPTSGSSGGW